MARRAGLWRGVVPAHRRGWLGPVQLRVLELGWSLGLDLGGLCALGLCSVSLWPLGFCWRSVGLVPWTDLCTSILRTGVRGLCWRRTLRSWLWRWFWRRNRLVPAGLS